MFFPEQIQLVEEDVGELFIPVHRSGDISQELMVVCSTQQGRDAHLTHLPSACPACLRPSCQTGAQLTEYIFVTFVVLEDIFFHFLVG